MRKLTYTEAATCGENLKVRVTNENAEKIKKSWVKNGKHADFQYNFGFVFLWNDGDLTTGDFEEFEGASDFEEIELIDDLSQPDFASQQDVWRWVDAGNKIKSFDGEVIGFKDGSLYSFTLSDKCGYNFLEFFNHWQKHTPPRLIRVNGVEVPAPLESLEGLSVVWCVRISRLCKENTEEYIVKHITERGCLDLIESKLCYATKEDAIKRAEAMMKFEVVE